MPFDPTVRRPSLLVPVALTAALLLGGCATTSQWGAAPTFELETLAGDPLHSDELAGQVVVMDFWATWCGPCIRSFPHLTTLYEAYADRDDVAFLAVNTSWQDTVEDARHFLASNRFFIPAYWDEDGATTRRFGVRSIPTTIVIGRDGRIAHRKSGFSNGPSYERALRRAIEEALAPPPADADPDALAGQSSSSAQREGSSR